MTATITLVLRADHAQLLTRGLPAEEVGVSLLRDQPEKRLVVLVCRDQQATVELLRHCASILEAIQL